MNKRNKDTQADSGRPSGRDETRQKLIDAGIEVFGDHGYEAATTRMLARAADANLAAIPYHFGGKEGLYHAVVQYIAGQGFEALADVRSAALTVIEDTEASRTELFEALASIIRAFARLVISSDFGSRFGPVIIREQFHPTSAFDHLYEMQVRVVHEVITTLVARLTGVSPESEEAIIRAHSVLGQIVAFRAMRETARRRLGWNNFDEENTRKVCEILVENVLRIVALRDEGEVQ